MASAQAGDREAYRQVLVAVQQWCLRFFRRRVPSAAVDDLVQETLLAVNNKRHTYNSSYPFWPWLAAIARYKWADYLRHVYRRRESELPLHLTMDPAEAWLDAMSLKTLLARLKPSQATAIRLVKLEGHSVREAALIMGQTEALVRVNVHRGIKQLRLLLED